MVSRREVLCSLAAAGSLAVTLPARAAGYPSSPVRLVLPYTSGSDDVQARIIARSLGGFLGQPIVVDAHPGAGGNVAAHYVAHASADGYTLLFATNSMLEVNPLMYADPGFNPLTDFAPVSFLAEHPFMLVVNPQVPARTVRELIDYGRKNPDKLTNATAGAGSALYLAGLQFMSKAGIRIVNVPYKGGAEDTLAVLSGAVSMEFGGVPNVRAYVQAGKLRPLAVSGSRRLEQFPDVPTIEEAGVPGFEFTAWSVLAAPAATPPPVLSTLRASVAKTLANGDVQRSLADLGFVPLTGSDNDTSGAGIQRRIEKETAVWRELLAHAGIKPS